MIESGLIQFLIADPTVNSIVGSNIFPDRLSAGNTRPCVLVQRIVSRVEFTHGGVDGLSHPTIQIDCLTNDYTTAKLLANRITKILNGYSGPMSGPLGNFTVQGAHLENGIDSFDIPMNANDRAIYRHTLDFVIWFGEF